MLVCFRSFIPHVDLLEAFVEVVQDSATGALKVVPTTEGGSIAGLTTILRSKINIPKGSLAPWNLAFADSSKATTTTLFDSEDHSRR